VGTEFGADIRLLGGRIGLDATFYDQTTRDQILGVEISKASGYHQRVLNAGRVVNKGVELMLTGTPLQLGNGLQWEVALNFARNRNKVLALAEGLTTYTLATRNGMSAEARVGQAYGTFYGNAFLRAPDGQLVFRDGLPQLAPGQKVLGNFQPDWLGGFSNTVSFKGVSLSALVDVKMGGDIYDEGTGIARRFAQRPGRREDGRRHLR
jgi:hypothetical protein